MATAAATDMESSEQTQKAPRRRKCKNHLVQLAELFPDVVYHVAAVYGLPEDQIYVVEVYVEGQVFQGIGPSKIKAKIMAAELALINYGVLEALTVHPTDITEVTSAGDFSADCTESEIYCDFSKPYCEDESVPWEKKRFAAVTGGDSLPTASADNDVADDSDVTGAVDDDDDDDDQWSRFIGKTSLTIVVELQLEAHYELLAETGDQLHPLFAMEAMIDGLPFRASGTNKKLAKARAARNALNKLYGLEFGTAENGMPIYEGNENIWESYKERLEKEAELLVQPGRNPLLVMADFFPEAAYEISADVNMSQLYSADVKVADITYSGVGTTKTDAKTNAAANALDDLRANGMFAAREREMASKRRGLLTDKHATALLHPETNASSKLLGNSKNAVSKLNILFRDRVHYCDLVETPIGHTNFTAFTVAVSVSGRHYVGVGKTKKAARGAAAERALVSLGLWTGEDESVKMAATAETDEDPVDAVRRMQDAVAWKREMHSLEQKGYGGSFQPPPPPPPPQWNREVRGGMNRGRGGWNAAGPGWEDDWNWAEESWDGQWGHDEWSDHDPRVRNWNEYPRGGGSFNNRRGRPAVSRSRGPRGGSIAEPFHRNADVPTTNSRGSWGMDGWKRGGQASNSRGRVNEKRSFPTGSTPLVSSTAPTTSASAVAPAPQFPTPSLTSTPFPASSSWSFAVNPPIGMYHPSANQNQTSLPSAVQQPASYLPATGNYYMAGMTPDMTFANDGGFYQPGSSQQQTVVSSTSTFPSYGSYDQSAYAGMYGYGSYTAYQ